MLSGLQLIPFMLDVPLRDSYGVYRYICHSSYSSLPVPVAARSKAWVCGCSLAEIVASNLTGDMNVCQLCVLSGGDLCDEPITRPEESCRLLYVVVCDLKAS